MTKSIELPIQECDLRVTVGRDGVWLHFGKYTCIHVHNKFHETGHIIAGQIGIWCKEREEQAQLLPGEMG